MVREGLKIRTKKKPQIVRFSHRGIIGRKEVRECLAREGENR